ncbi:MAG: heme NO-binding domain-containing protein [Myxococcota bacterium]
MYGLVNKAIEQLVVANYGEARWREVKDKAGLELGSFVGMKAYPDALTYKLVGAASEVLDLEPGPLLEAFGEYWILYTAREGYGELLEASGGSFVEFLENLDMLHARIRLTMPSLKPPSIRVTDVGTDSVRVHYHSDRDGLAPMVVGLLRGLGKRFSTPVEVVHDKVRGKDGDHDEFVANYVTALTS